jgi:hypothetical protein
VVVCCCGVATRAQQIAELETELTTLKSARTSALVGGSSSQIGDLSISGVSSSAINDRIMQVEKSLQRLKNGGRGIVIDMSARADGGAA